MPQIGTTPANPTTAPSAPANNGKAKKASGKKAKKATAAKKAGGSKKPKGERGPSKTQISVLKLLKGKPDGMTRAQLADKLETFIGGDIMGHVDTKKEKKNSLTGRGLVSITGGAPRKLKDGSFSDTEGASIYKITAAGRKVLESL